MTPRVGIYNLSASLFMFSPPSLPQINVKM